MSGAMARPGPARTRSESRQRTALVALRLLPNERALTEAARFARETLSEFIRSSALQAVDSQLKPDTRGADSPGSQDVVQNVASALPSTAAHTQPDIGIDGRCQGNRYRKSRRRNVITTVSYARLCVR